MKLFGVDVGGTFTDVFFNDTEKHKTFIHKLPTTLEDPSVGVINGILELSKLHNVVIEEINHIFHGTTIGTNAILEFDGAHTGMITTEGYKDIMHIGRHQRPENYSIMQDIPWQNQPLIQRRNRKTVSERMGPKKGEVIKSLNEDEVRAAVNELKELGVESIIVGFLFSYINPEHEQRVVEIIKEEYPEAFITSSSDVSPQFREFERFTTAGLNGFIGPKVKNYVGNLSEGLKSANISADLHIMCSNGGVATPENIAAKPVNTLLSGPAAGVLGGAYAGALSDRKKLITFDIGGTSADIGIVTEDGFGEASARDTWIAGYPVMVPMIDIHTIGAGGGSIAYIDEGGLFKVGPKSAGSVPGPACYGHGGTFPTVSDANVVLGRLDQENFLGGEMKLHTEAAHQVIGELADKLGMTKEETAEGVLRILNNNMANAIREKTIQKGADPREFSLVAFGGAGPLHAVDVARELKIPEIVIPPYPGINSATGLLTTDLKYDVIKTEFMLSSELELGILNEDFQALEEGLRQQLIDDHVNDEDVSMLRFAECRYVGQGYELRVPLPNEELIGQNIEKYFDLFHEMHRNEYGHAFKESPIEIVNIRVTGLGKMPKLNKEKMNERSTLEEAIVKTENVTFRHKGELRKIETIHYQRELLPVGIQIEGPAIIFQKDTTTVIPPDNSFSLEEFGNLIIKVGDQS
ncbi:hydantoinase/oxoprolinase family protein [Planomicrobium sp. YIM 101495]|uniref:hydantoinase/oxoprolinase family protein n=1 Tax=Planomicrobium sp. YIM 101495 TaxID=2665160 RepID=UPI0012B7C6C1|nr:hydantoinase/oxoprolinase family protein [Planomicrobium sp. YIM 101495]MTD30726.1 hydantoinase/oxoprolinase family protein [Planomicrobium sp. YIM 101495]